MRHVFTLAAAGPLGRDSVDGAVYSRAGDFDRLSAVRVRTRPGQRHGMIRNIACDRLYFVISGTGTFRIGDVRHAAAASDVVIIPRGTPYDYWGELEMLLVHAPANIDEADINLEEPPFPV